MSAPEPDHEQQVVAALLEAKRSGRLDCLEVIDGSTGIQVLTPYPGLNLRAIEALCSTETKLAVIEVVSYDPFEGDIIEPDWIVSEVIRAGDKSSDQNTTVAVIGPGAMAIVESTVLIDAEASIVTLRLRGAANMAELVELALALLEEKLFGLSVPRFTSVFIARGRFDAEVQSHDTAKTIEAKLTEAQS